MISSKLCDYTVLDRKGRIPAEDTRNRRIKQMLINAAKEIQDQNEHLDRMTRPGPVERIVVVVYKLHQILVTRS